LGQRASVIADAVVPVAMAPLKAMLDEVVAHRAPIFV
jgi:hypothetical protein